MTDIFWCYSRWNVRYAVQLMQIEIKTKFMKILKCSDKIGVWHISKEFENRNCCLYIHTHVLDQGVQNHFLSLFILDPIFCNLQASLCFILQFLHFKLHFASFCNFFTSSSTLQLQSPFSASHTHIKVSISITLHSKKQAKNVATTSILRRKKKKIKPRKRRFLICVSHLRRG